MIVNMAGGNLAAAKPDTSKIYYASAAEIEAAKARAAERILRKAEFQKKYTNPLRGVSNGGYIFDPAMQRYMSMRVSMYDHYRFNGRNLWKFLLTTVIPIVGIYKYLNYQKERNERIYGSGAIPYSDRLWKR